MPNRIIYCLASVDEIYECSYSLLKYLDVYNLKPPVDHGLLIYTNKPALLEAYGAYFNDFDLREFNPAPESVAKLEQVRKIVAEEKGNILYMPSNSYFVKELGNLFMSIAQGTIFTGKKSTEVNAIPVLGFNSERQNLQSTLDAKNAKSTQGFIEQYDDLKEFRKLLKDFFRKYQEESIPNQVKLMHSIDAAKMQDEKNKFKQLPLHQRLLRKMMGKGWSIMGHRK
jgi:hypothetical protein